MILNASVWRLIGKAVVLKKANVTSCVKKRVAKRVDKNICWVVGPYHFNANQVARQLDFMIYFIWWSPSFFVFCGGSRAIEIS